MIGLIESSCEEGSCESATGEGEDTIYKYIRDTLDEDDPSVFLHPLTSPSFQDPFDRPQVWQMDIMSQTEPPLEQTAEMIRTQDRSIKHFTRLETLPEYRMRAVVQGDSVMPELGMVIQGMELARISTVEDVPEVVKEASRAERAVPL
ncbi:hypothetical protein IAT38_007442 [Cryptococcus sp. DSM 104549]